MQIGEHEPFTHADWREMCNNQPLWNPLPERLQPPQDAQAGMVALSTGIGWAVLVIGGLLLWLFR